ncbi:unnamed protein product [Auanema sp. JU1783]|nr:unnamed protein product [Auanema sp. JU1783]
MATLRIRRNEIKLNVYRHFTNCLVFAILASVCFMIWSLLYHVFPSCLKEWKGIWIDVAFWHVLFVSILIAIMFLWRPSQNNQRYAFTPLLDNSEDENDQDEIFNSSSPGFEVLKQRELGGGADARKAREQEKEEKELKEDLRWIEDHIPTSLTDQLVMDEVEEEEMKALQISKML